MGEMCCDCIPLFGQAGRPVFDMKEMNTGVYSSNTEGRRRETVYILPPAGGSYILMIVPTCLLLDGGGGMRHAKLVRLVQII